MPVSKADADAEARSPQLSCALPPSRDFPLYARYAEELRSPGFAPARPLQVPLYLAPIDPVGAAIARTRADGVILTIAGANAPMCSRWHPCSRLTRCRPATHCDDQG